MSGKSSNKNMGGGSQNRFPRQLKAKKNEPEPWTEDERKKKFTGRKPSKQGGTPGSSAIARWQQLNRQKRGGSWKSKKKRMPLHGTKKKNPLSRKRPKKEAVHFQRTGRGREPKKQKKPPAADKTARPAGKQNDQIPERSAEEHRLQTPLRRNRTSLCVAEHSRQISARNRKGSKERGKTSLIFNGHKKRRKEWGRAAGARR